MQAEKRIRVGLVGLGNWGRYGHIPALKLLPEYEITAVSSRSLARALAATEEFGIRRAYDSVEALAADPNVDLVAVLSPAPEHASAVRSAVAAGKDVYCEWPLTTTTADSEGLLRLVGDRGSKHLVGLQRTVGASSEFLKALLAEVSIGQLRSVRMYVSMGSFGPVRSPSLAWTIPSDNFSHVLSIYGGHFMDMLFHAVGKPLSLSALVKSQFKELTLSSTGEKFPNETPDTVMVMGTLPDDAVFQIHLEGGKQTPSGLRIDLVGVDGELRIRNDKAFVTKHHDVVEGLKGDAKDWLELKIPDSCVTIPTSPLDVSVQDLAQLYRSFSNDCRDGTRSGRDFADALYLHRLIDSIQQASLSRQVISVEAI